VTVSVGTFVPKPHTPFQWERQIGMEEAWERLDILKRSSPKGIKLKWHDPRQSFLEGVFSRGDRMLFQVLETAWRKGARLSGWSDFFDLAPFFQAARENGLDLYSYLEPMDIQAALPWDHLETGVKKDYLLKELKRAFSLEHTTDCRHGACNNCGVCDFDSIKPKIHELIPRSRRVQEIHLSHTRPNYYLITYAKVGMARFFGHLDSMRAIERSFRRTGMRLAFSRGFHPHPLLQFEDALPLGSEVVGAMLRVGLVDAVPLQKMRELLNRTAPEGFHFLAARGPFHEKVPIPKRNRSCLLWWEGIEDMKRPFQESLLKGLDRVKIWSEGGHPHHIRNHLSILPHPWNDPGQLFLHVVLMDEERQKVPEVVLGPLFKKMGVDPSDVRRLMVELNGGSGGGQGEPRRP